MRVGLMALAVASSLTLATPAAAVDDGARLGSDGVGDPFFPQGGNGGYDVAHYDLDLAWYPSGGSLHGVAHIEATATQPLDRLNLDLRMPVISVKVKGVAATFRRVGQELIITPAAKIRSGTRFTVDINYAGRPKVVIDPDGAPEGWMPWSGGVVALGEPQGSPAWFPANDHPTDKATYEIKVSVPRGKVAVSNGRLVSTIRQGARTTYRWRQNRPMATYLATLSLGDLTLTRTTTPSGLPMINAVAPSMQAESAPVLALIPEALDWLTTLYGPYPFDSTGAIVVDAPDVGYALETQDRPTFTGVPDEFILVHELAHQWVGNSVSPAEWPELWLNEGFATYAEWLYAEHEGIISADDIFAFYDSVIPADDPFWTLPIGPDTLPGPEFMFFEPVYVRGAMTLHEVRRAIGDEAFFATLLRWTTENRNGNVTTDDYVALVEGASGQSLDALFTAWLDTPSKPVSSARVAAPSTPPPAELLREGARRH